MKTVLDLLIIAGRFAAGLWPVMFLALFIGIFKANKGFGISFRLVVKWLLISWGFFAMLHLVFFLLKMDTFKLISEPANSQAFLIVGLVLIPFAFAMVLESRQNHLTADSIAEMRSLSPAEFETLVANTYRAQGHSVEIVGGTGDHGIDLVVHSRTNEIWFIQCKRYKGKIGEPVVRDFYGALRAANADCGAIITTGEITQKARLWAEGKPIRLYDGAQFLKIVTSTRARATIMAEEDKTFSRRRTDQPASTPIPAMQPAFAAAGAVTAGVTAGVNAIVNAFTPRRDTATVEEDETPMAVEPAPVTAAADISAPVLVTSSAAQTVLHSSLYDDPLPSYSESPDKAPFMNLNEPPECPVCNLPMVEKTVKNVLGQVHYKYVCQNAPECRVTLPKE
ncbi:MAG: restriction endonuclease [Anaerolineaceae bacterium]